MREIRNLGLPWTSPRSVAKLGSRKVLNDLIFCRKTYYVIFIWVFTWYSYWIFMKGQMSVINIIGASISGTLFTVSHFSTVRDEASRAPKLVMFQIRKTLNLTHTSLGAPAEILQQRALEPITQKQEPVISQTIDENKQSPSKSNGCPKNLDYFTKKPRPKKAPEECFTCKNLITCVCETSN